MFHPHDVKPLGLTTIGLRAPGRALQSSCCCHRSSSLPGARRGIVKHCPDKAPIKILPIGGQFSPKTRAVDFGDTLIVDLRYAAKRFL